MAPARTTWDDEDDSTPPSSPPPGPALARRSKFDDEEEDEDVVESWDAADDSDAEAEKAKQAAERKAKADAEAAANKKSKAQRVAELKAERARQEAEDEETSSDEDEAAKRERLRRTEKDSDMKHAEDLFGDLSVGSSKRTAPSKAVVAPDPADPSRAIDLSTLPVFKATTKDEFARLGDLLAPLMAANAKKAHYSMFLQDFTRRVAADLPSEQIKKVASGLTTLANQKMQDEKAAERGGKKTKAAKSKTSLVADRGAAHKADTTSYDDGLDEDDFM